MTIAGEAVGHLGVIAPAALKRFDLDEPIVAAELGLSRFYDGYPPETEAHALPSFPAIERDVSVIVGEQVPWAALAGTAQSQQPELMEAIEFVTVFRGKPIPPRHKSVTLRCRFRAPDRTLTHDEVDPQMALVVRRSSASTAPRFAADLLARRPPCHCPVNPSAISWKRSPPRVPRREAGRLPR